jgi:hypothetical protein
LQPEDVHHFFLDDDGIVQANYDPLLPWNLGTTNDINPWLYRSVIIIISGQPGLIDSGYALALPTIGKRSIFFARSGPGTGSR